MGQSEGFVLGWKSGGFAYLHRAHLKFRDASHDRLIFANFVVSVSKGAHVAFDS